MKGKPPKGTVSASDVIVEVRPGVYERRDGSGYLLEQVIKPGEIMKHRRKELRMSMQELGDAIGVSKSTISRYESGEALALRKQDFDMKSGTFHVYHQIKYYEDGFFDLKTDSSERTLKIPPSLQAVLRPILARCTKKAPFVFGGETSLPITNVRRRFDSAIKASGVHPIRIHDLRHSFASNMIANGANIVAVSHYLGHSTIQQTLQTYTHLLEQTDDAMIGTIDTLMGV